MANEVTTSHRLDQHFDEVLAEYLEAARLGRAPGRPELLARHPDLAAELESFFADDDLMRDLAEPLRCNAAAGCTPSPDSAVTATFSPDDLPRRFGDYELLEEISRGGMGVVYRARQISLDRVVALKMILPGGRSPEEIERFLHTEAQAVASLDHPHIVPIYEAGTHDGRPFFSMKLIDGVDLTRWRRDSAPVPQRRVARLLAAVARAVHHAHQRGILHRDLKPSNVLLDPAGQPHVTDFGLAKRVEGDSALSQSGAITGTPGYMAPEQAAGEKRLTTAVDVYGMGAILYELLTGRPPFRGETPLDTILSVRSQELTRPSVLNPKVDRDLETICLKCLEKEPSHRYGSAESLAEDLERWLRGEPIAARRAGAWEKLAKWGRRKPALASLAATVVVFAASVVGLAAWGWSQAARAQQAAEKQTRAEADARAAAEGQANEARLRTRYVEARLALVKGTHELHRGEIGPGLLWLVRGLELAPPEERALKRSFRALLSGWGRQVHTLRLTIPVPPPSLPAPCVYQLSIALRPDGKVVAWAGESGVELYDLGTGKRLGQPLPFEGKVACLEFSPDGKTLAIGEAGKQIQLWDVERRQPVGKPMPQPRNQLSVFCWFTPDGKTLIASFPDDNGQQVWFWNVETGKPIAGPIPPTGTYPVTVSADGKRVLTGEAKGAARSDTVRLWDAVTGEPLGHPLQQGYQVWDAEFSPDGRTVFTGGVKVIETGLEPGVVRRWDLATGKPIGPAIWHPAGVQSVGLSRDGTVLLTGSKDRYVRLWNAWTGKPIGKPVFQSNFDRTAFSPDGRTVYLNDDPGMGRLLDSATGATLGDRLRGGQSGIDWFAFGPGGRTLVTANGFEIRLHDIARDRNVRELLGQEKPLAVGAAISPDGKKVITTTWMTARIRNIATGGPVGQPIKPGGVIWHKAFSPDGQTVLTASDNEAGGSVVRLWDAATGKPFGEPLAHENRRGEVGNPVPVFRPDGKALFVVDGLFVRLWNPSNGKTLLRLGQHKDRVTSLALSPDGSKVLTASVDRTARLWDAATGKPLGEPLAHAGPVVFVEFSPNGKTVLTIVNDPEEARFVARVWNAATGKQIGKPIPIAPLSSGPLARFSPDGRLLLAAAGGGRGQVRLWDTATGEPLGEPLEHPHQIDSFAFSPDGRTIVTGGLQADRQDIDSGQGVIHLWDTTTRLPLGAPLRLNGGANPNLLFSPDGRFVLVAGSGNWGLPLWQVPQPSEEDVARLRLWLEVATGLELDAGGAVVELDAKTWQQRRQQLDKLGGPP
jgi:WD40 repeat protein